MVLKNQNRSPSANISMVKENESVLINKIYTIYDISYILNSTKFMKMRKYGRSVLLGAVSTRTDSEPERDGHTFVNCHEN